MPHKRFVLQILTAPGLALVALILTMIMPAFVWADDPDITIVKEADQVIVSGSDAIFTITITNSGDITLTNITVIDDETADCNKSDFADLGPNESTPPYICTSYSVAGSFTNTAVVTAAVITAPSITTVHSDTATVTVADIDFQKTTDTPMVSANSSVVFTLTLENTGDVAVSDVNIVDPLCGPVSGPLSDSGVLGTLDLGETWTYNCTVSSGTVDFTNVATVTATASGVGLEATASAPVDVINPSINVEVTPPTRIVSVGSNADFTITVENTGDVELDNVNVSATECGPLSGPTGDIGSDNQLSNGEIWTYTCTRFSVPDGLINSVTVDAKTPINTDVTDSDAAAVILTEAATQCLADMAAYWKLDEGGQPYDDFYSGHDAQCVSGNCPSPTKGRVNGGQTFNGASTGVDVPVIPGDDSFNWGKDDSFSIEFWMRGVSGQTCAGSGIFNNEVIIGRDDASTDLHWWLGCENTSGIAHFQLRDITGNGNTAILRSTGKPINDGAWHHIVSIRDGINKLNRLYVDGTEVASTTFTYNAGFSSTSAPLNVGWLNLDSGYHFEGDLDEVAVYNRALTPNEIQTHYNYRNSGIPSPGYCVAAPFIISTAPEYANVGEAYTYTVMAIGDPIPTYSLSDSPPSMEITPNTGVLSWTATISWTPTTTQSETVTVEATNSEGDDTQVFTITVLPAGVAPTIPVYLPVILKQSN